MKPYVWGAFFAVVALIALGAVFAHLPTGPSAKPKPPAAVSTAAGGAVKPGGGNGVPPATVQIPKLAVPPPIPPVVPFPAGAPALPSPLPVPVTPPPLTPPR